MQNNTDLSNSFVSKMVEKLQKSGVCDNIIESRGTTTSRSKTVELYGGKSYWLAKPLSQVKKVLAENFMSDSKQSQFPNLLLTITLQQGKYTKIDKKNGRYHLAHIVVSEKQKRRFFTRTQTTVYDILLLTSVFIVPTKNSSSSN